MYNNIQTIIEERITSEVTGFVTVGTALRDDQPKRPDALVWLGEDAGVSDSPAVLRELTWYIKVSVNHSETVGVSQAFIYSLIDQVRTAFAGWVPDNTDYVGFQKGFHVPSIKFTGHDTKGDTEYHIQIVHRVFPKNFSIL